VRSFALVLCASLVTAPAIAQRDPSRNARESGNAARPTNPLDDLDLNKQLTAALASADLSTHEALGATYLQIGHHRLAIAEYQALFELAEKAGASEGKGYLVRALIGLARANAAAREWKTAQAQLERALGAALPAKSFVRERLDGRLALGEVLLALGDAGAAERIFSEVTGELAGTPSLIVPQLGLTMCRIQADDFDGAAALLAAIAAPKSGPQALALARTHAFVAIARGSLDEARGHIERAGEIGFAEAAKQLASFSSEELDLPLAERTQIDADFAVSVALLQKTPEARRFAFTAAIARKGLVLDLVAERQRILRSIDDQTLRERVAYLAELRADLGEAERTRAIGDTGDPSAAKLIESIRSVEQLIHFRVDLMLKDRALADRFLHPELLERRRTLRAEAIEAALGDAALIEIVRRRVLSGGAWSEAHYLAFVVRSDRDIELVDLGPARAIDEHVRALRTTLADATRDPHPAARKLDRAVFEPLVPKLGGARALWIAPDGDLHLIPFAALVDRQNQWRAAGYEIRYLASAAELVSPKRRANSQSAPLVLANPAFDDMAPPEPAKPSAGGQRSRRIHFTPLPGTGREATAITTFVPTATVLTGAQATKSALEAARAVPILHIATHGFFLGAPLSSAAGPDTRGATPADTPAGAPADSRALKLVEAPRPTSEVEPMLVSGIALAGANTSKDGVLSAAEISALRLDGTDLAVLSACETGVGAVANGEGVFGLRRALVIAGTHTQVLSLWRIDDDATAALMGDYYRRLAAGAPRHAALRAVQLELAKSSRTAHPYFWASFVASGDDGPITAIFRKNAPQAQAPPKTNACRCSLPGEQACPPWLVFALALGLARRFFTEGGSLRRSPRPSPRW
jgi:CHAT domain-containing protein